MSKRQGKSQASSSRNILQTHDATGNNALRPIAGNFGKAASSLSYLAEQPDLMSLDDQNVVVHFKNLAKKDPTTKSKALEDLSAYVDSNADDDNHPLEDHFLAAWVKIYPRTSIDSSRRVRQLSHTVNGQVCLRGGKRIAKHMSAIVGAWVTGCNDTDKLVSRAAKQALTVVFPTKEKRANVIKLYQPSILEFCADALFSESAETLSDVRTTNADDSNAKYFQLVSNAIASLGHLLDTLSIEDIAQHMARYEAIFCSSELWKFCRSRDLAVRRSLFELLRTCLRVRKALLESYIDLIRENFLSNKTFKAQIGSAADLAQCLDILSQEYSMLWTPDTEYAASRFSDFVRHGSMSSPPIYWTHVDSIFEGMSKIINSLTSTQGTQIIEALHTGINRKEEPRANLKNAWTCYDNVLQRISNMIDPNDRYELMSKQCLPILKQYLEPTTENMRWNVPSYEAMNTVARMVRHESMLPLIETSWPSFAFRFIDEINESLENTRDSAMTQDAIKKKGERWFAIQGQVLEESSKSTLLDVMRKSTDQILKNSIAILKSTRGNAFGSAGVLAAALRFNERFVLDTKTTSTLIDDFICNEVPNLLASPSSDALIAVLYRSSRSPKFDLAWRASLSAILKDSNTFAKSQNLEKFLLNPELPTDVEVTANDLDLQSYLSHQIELASLGQVDWSLLVNLLKPPYQILSNDNMEQLLTSMTNSLMRENTVNETLDGLQALITSRKSPFLAFLAQTGELSRLRKNVLFLTESFDETVATKAVEADHKLDAALAESTTQFSSADVTVSNVIEGLYEANQLSLSVDTILDVAKKYIGRIGQTEAQTAKQLMPQMTVWTRLLEPLVHKPLPSALAISTQLEGVLYLQIDNERSGVDVVRFSYDQEGYSPLVRLALYTCGLMKETSLFNLLDNEAQCDLFHNLIITTQMINDDLSMDGINKLWSSSSMLLDGEMVDLVAATETLFTYYMKTIGTGKEGSEARSSFVKIMQEQLWSQVVDYSPASVKSARAYLHCVNQNLEFNSLKTESIQNLEAQLRALHQKGTSLQLLSFLGAYKDQMFTTATYKYTCNETVAKITGMDNEAEEENNILRQLILFNLLGKDCDAVISTIAKQRMVFLVKHVIPWIADVKISRAIKAEVCKLLTTIFPWMADIYGEHWVHAINHVVDEWKDLYVIETDLVLTPSLPFLHASIKLMDRLRLLCASEEVNDDLKEAWQESSRALSGGLILVLKRLGQFSDVSNQPLRTVGELIGRQVSFLEPENVGEMKDLYPLVISESTAVQNAAFGLLHKRIPNKQEQISVDIALDNTSAHLPEELVSLLIATPSHPTSVETSLDWNMPHSLRGYLAGWLLVFDHFQNASEKLRADYTLDLKEGGYANALLDFTFDFLGHSQGKPVDASKFDVTVYSFNVQESALMDVQWLLIHLYYLCLRRTPSIGKTWWMDCKSRQTVVQVEMWTEKYISPHVITAALRTVEEWTRSQDTGLDETLNVKVNERSKEIVVSKEIDEQNMSMAIRLPNNFPLGQALAHGVNRVLVDEKKWRSWLLNTQGVIVFSNNSIVDGIIAFRRNVNGALKGQSECAICYSIVGADKQLPTKKCGTCKNLFHGSCLYRWFKSSNSSTCPLCRNAFSYT